MKITLDLYHLAFQKGGDDGFDKPGWVFLLCLVGGGLLESVVLIV